jgi:hypothetical protein
MLNDDAMARQDDDIPLLAGLVMAGGVEIPEDKYDLISKVHNALVGHRGVQRTLDYLRAQGQSWSEMRQHVSNFIRQCPTCQKMDTRSKETFAQPYSLADQRPNKSLSMDTLEVQYDDLGFKHILVILDNFTRWIELVPIKSLSSDEAAVAIMQHFNRYGCPEDIRTDNSTQFINEQLAFVTKWWQVNHIRITPHSHEENGMVERANKEVLRHLRAFVFDNRLANKWSRAVPFVQRILNTTPNAITGFTPSELTFGPARDLDAFVCDTLGESNDHIPNSMEDVFELHRNILEIAQERQRKDAEEHLEKVRGAPEHYPVGSYVLVEYPSSMAGKRPPTKLHTYKRGPLKVVEVSGSEYGLRDCVTQKVEQVHVSRIYPFEYDPERVNPETLAYRDRDEFMVERIVDHTDNGNPKNKTYWEFLVRWQGYPPDEDRWLKWRELRDNTRLHDYLRDNGLQRLIPPEFRDNRAPAGDHA